MDHPNSELQPLFDAARRLVQLLEDPEPGLITWQIAIQRERNFIWEFTTKKET